MPELTLFNPMINSMINYKSSLPNKAAFVSKSSVLNEPAASPIVTQMQKIEERTELAWVNIFDEMRKNAKKHHTYVHNILKEIIKDPSQSEYLKDSSGSVDSIIAQLELAEKNMKSSIRSLAKGLKRRQSEQISQAHDELYISVTGLIETLKPSISVCQELRWQIMIYEGKKEPKGELCETAEDFLESLWGEERVLAGRLIPIIN